MWLAEKEIKNKMEKIKNKFPVFLHEFQIGE